MVNREHMETCLKGIDVAPLRSSYDTLLSTVKQEHVFAMSSQSLQLSAAIYFPMLGQGWKEGLVKTLSANFRGTKHLFT